MTLSLAKSFRYAHKAITVGDACKAVAHVAADALELPVIPLAAKNEVFAYLYSRDQRRANGDL
jgi:hypothetical protein